jgi:hypothetical protein
MKNQVKNVHLNSQSTGYIFDFNGGEFKKALKNGMPGDYTN